MKVIIFSDSHGTLKYMERAIEKEQPDQILHLGDHETDAVRLGQAFSMIPLLAVRGNCDGDTQAPNQRVFQLEEHRIYMCHGHLLGVKEGLLRAEYTAREAKADIFLFGHTHIPFAYRFEDGLLMFNPGTCGGLWKRTYGLLTIRGNTLTYTIEKI